MRRSSMPCSENRLGAGARVGALRRSAQMSAAEWKDLLELRIVPVLDDAETGEAVSRVFRK